MRNSAAKAPPEATASAKRSRTSSRSSGWTRVKKASGEALRDSVGFGRAAGAAVLQIQGPVAQVGQGLGPGVLRLGAAQGLFQRLLAEGGAGDAPEHAVAPRRPHPQEQQQGQAQGDAPPGVRLVQPRGGPPGVDLMAVAQVGHGGLEALQADVGRPGPLPAAGQLAPAGLQPVQVGGVSRLAAVRLQAVQVGQGGGDPPPDPGGGQEGGVALDVGQVHQGGEVEAGRRGVHIPLPGQAPARQAEDRTQDHQPQAHEPQDVVTHRPGVCPQSRDGLPPSCHGLFGPGPSAGGPLPPASTVGADASGIHVTYGKKYS
jgi:hypothetical protein